MTALRLFVAGHSPSDEPSSRSLVLRARRAPGDDVAISSSVSNLDRCAEAIRAGDAHALDELAREHFTALWEFALAFVRAPDVADDVVQEVFLRLWINRATWEPRGSVRGYLFGAVRNEALHRMRHARVVHRAGTLFLNDPLPPAMGTPVGAPDTLVEADEIERALAVAVRSLGERQQELLVLRVRHGLTPAEIAKVTGMSAGAVRTALSRIRDLLRPVMEQFAPDSR
jgi:RNA polymerase sigma-70 factor (ECF subfamily)